MLIGINTSSQYYSKPTPVVCEVAICAFTRGHVGCHLGQDFDCIIPDAARTTREELESLSLGHYRYAPRSPTYDRERESLEC